MVGSDRNTSCVGHGGDRERKVGMVMTQKTRDWTQTEIGGTGRWSKIAGAEIRDE